MRQVTRKGLITVAAAGGVFALGGGVAHADATADGQAVGSPGVLSGNNVQVPVHVPVNVCGNTVNVIGLLNPAMGNSCANASGGRHGSDDGRHGSSAGSGHDGRHHGAQGGRSHDDGGYGGGGGHDRGHGGGYGGGSHHGQTHGTPPRTGGHDGSHAGGSHAGGGTSHSPGVGSGNQVGVPIDIPVNVCDLGVGVVDALSPVFGGSCENDETPAPPVVRTPPHHPATPHTPTNRNIPPAPNTPVTQTVTPPVPVAATSELAHTGAGGLGVAVPAAAGMLLAGTILYRRSRAAA